MILKLHEGFGYQSLVSFPVPRRVYAYIEKKVDSFLEEEKQTIIPSVIEDNLLPQVGLINQGGIVTTSPLVFALCYPPKAITFRFQKLLRQSPFLKQDSFEIKEENRPSRTIALCIDIAAWFLIATFSLVLLSLYENPHFILKLFSGRETLFEILKSVPELFFAKTFLLTMLILFLVNGLLGSTIGRYSVGLNLREKGMGWIALLALSEAVTIGGLFLAPLLLIRKSNVSLFPSLVFEKIEESRKEEDKIREQFIKPR